MTLHPSDMIAPRPGSNLKDAATGAAWTYLLDSLEARRLLVLGRPDPSAVATLDRLSESVVIADALDDLPAGVFDVVYVAPVAARWLETAGAVSALAQRVAAPGGQLCIDASGPIASQLESAEIPFDRYWATPARGEMRSAVPANDSAVRRYFVANRIVVPSMPRLLRAFDRHAPVAASRRRTILLARPAGGRLPTGSPSIPAYLEAIAHEAGVDLRAHRFGLSARGRYSSRKVIFYLFPPGAEHPDLIVKTTRDPVHNARLVNEERALRLVAASKYAEAGTAPGVAFSGEHGGLALVGEEAIGGVLLNARAQRADAVGAYAWITHLGAASARWGPTEAAAIRATVEDIADAVARVYALAPAQSARLAQAVGTLAHHAEKVPLVMMHGDPTSGNALRRSDGRIAFLDWESATADGLPLWDLFHFARAHLLDMVTLRRVARQPQRLIEMLRRDATLQATVERYVEVLGVPVEVVEPLFLTGWAYRALKEVSRLRATELQTGHYIGLVRASLDRIES